MLLKVTETLKSILEKDSITSKEFEEVQSILALCRKIEDKFIFKYTFNKKHAEKNTTDLPKDRWGVHEGHCCIVHGCKYGKSNCPVELAIVKQETPCEQCWWEDNWLPID